MLNKTYLILLLIVIINSCNNINTSTEKFIYNEFIIKPELKNYSDNKLIYTVFADTAFSYNDSIMYFVNVRFKNEKNSIVIESKRGSKTDSFMTYYENVKIFLEDSMELFTDSLRVSFSTDSVSTDDSILIIKDNNTMKTKGMLSDIDFKRIEFYNEVIIYGEEI